MLYDLSRLHGPLGTSAIRLAYYLFSTFDKQWAQSDGTTILHVVTSAPRPPMEMDKKIWNSVLSALPARLKQTMVAQSVEDGREHLIESLAYQQALVSQFKMEFPAERLASHSTEGIRDLLLTRGIPLDCFPPCLGGSYDYRRFDEWTRNRLAIEESSTIDLLRPAKGPRVIPAVPVAFLSPPLPPAQASSPQHHQGQGTQVDGDYHRKRNAMYARRFYHKQNLAVSSLQEQVKVLERRNMILRESNVLLEELLAQARTVESEHETPGKLPGNPTGDL